MNRQLLAGLILVALISNADDDGVFDLTIAAPLDVTVLVTPRQKEELTTAPGIVSVVTRSQIQSYGANNLHDILRGVPGLMPLGMFVIRDNQISVRGQHSSSIDRRQLLLVNSWPFRDASTGGFNAALYRGFPISAIERIEIIRSPGSVLHGTNAVSGVINIVTQENQDAGISVSTGSFSYHNLEASYGIEGESGFINLAAKVSRSDGWNFEAQDKTGLFQTLDYGTNDFGFFLQAGYGDFSLGFLQARAEDDTIGLQFGHARWPETSYDKRRRLVDVNYHRDLTNDSMININVTLNQQD